MQVHWLLDADMFDHYRDELVEAIRAQGHVATLVRAPQPPYTWEDVGGSAGAALPADACVIAHGDISLVTRIRHERHWSPGVFASVDHFSCTSYYCHYGEHLLNGDYTMLPFGELSRCRELLFRNFGIEGRIFVRPDSTLKHFSGQTASRETFDADLEFMGFYDFPRNSLVIASSPKVIEAEWRFVVANHRVIAGCQYKRNEAGKLAAAVDPEALAAAEKIAAVDYQPDPVYIVDIGRTEDRKYGLLEVGPFSFCDLYACDKPSIVRAVSAAAQTAWKQGQSRSATVVGR